MQDGSHRWFVDRGAGILPSVVAYKVREIEDRSLQLQPLPDLQLQSRGGKKSNLKVWKLQTKEKQNYVFSE